VVAPVAVAAGKKAIENPAGSLIMMVLVGAVLIQGVKNLPNLADFLLGKIPGADIVKAPFVWTREAIETTAALNDEVITGFDQIGPEQDPVERFFFADDFSVEVYEPGEIGTAQKAYRGARTGLFTGLFNRGWFY